MAKKKKKRIEDLVIMLHCKNGSSIGKVPKSWIFLFLMKLMRKLTGYKNKCSEEKMCMETISPKYSLSLDIPNAILTRDSYDY